MLEARSFFIKTFMINDDERTEYNERIISDKLYKWRLPEHFHHYSLFLQHIDNYHGQLVSNVIHNSEVYFCVSLCDATHLWFQIYNKWLMPFEK